MHSTRTQRYGAPALQGDDDTTGRAFHVDQQETATVVVNGQSLAMTGTAVHATALDWLRARGLTGAKEGCAEGECGACSILVARPGMDTAAEWVALNSCLVPVAALDGQELVTAEGLGTSRALHPVQREMAVRGGSQCGYCTPGFVCSMAAEYYRPGRAGEMADSAPAEGTARAEDRDGEHGPNGFDLHALSGNLCRCTGYRPIRDAAFALEQPPEDDPFARRCDAPAPVVPATRVASEAGEFVRPATLEDALALLAQRPEAVLLAGSTDLGVAVNLLGARPALVVAIDRLPELRGFHVGDEHVEIGAALSLTEVERRLAGRVPLLAELFPQFASRLIRNGATLGGNLGTASPIGDAPPVLLALDAVLVLTSVDGEREVPLAEYFTGYRRTVRRSEELIRAVRIPLPLSSVTGFHKVAKRRFDDISSVAVAFALDVEEGVVRKARIGVGGVAATPLRARATERALTGQPWSSSTVRTAADVLGAEGTPLDDHRASSAYRSAMLRQVLLKLHSQNTSLAEVGA
jgi:xanthine dehydrogenase small subunit